MIFFRDVEDGLRELEIPRSAPVIAHTSLSAFGHVHGGAEALLGTMMNCFETIVMPAFTYKTMIIPEVGPPDNGLVYGQYQESNMLAQLFDVSMPVDRLMGVVPETLRRHPQAKRSRHPILSFVGIGANSILDSQTLDGPLGPIGEMNEREGWVLLLGVDHDVNTSVHYGERLAGRKQFVRWALTPQGVVVCPLFPGCSDGFSALGPRLAHITRQTQVGNARVQAVPLQGLIQTVKNWVKEDALALLCDRPYCERCEATRKLATDPSKRFHLP